MSNIDHDEAFLVAGKNPRKATHETNNHPKQMNTAQKLIDDANQIIAKARQAIELIDSNAELFNQFGAHSSFDAFQGGTFFLHGAPDDCKPFCRAIGSGWRKEDASDSRINYFTTEGHFKFHIFGAEKKRTEVLDL